MTCYQPSPRFPGYFAGDDGSVLRPDGTKTFGAANGKGYYYAYVAGQSIRVNIFVCESFHGLKPDEGMEAAHINGIRSDNRPVNLTWKTQKDNDADKDIHGTRFIAHGERNGKTIITEDIVRRIRGIYHSGKANTSQIAKLFGLEKSGVAKIIKGTRWGHVE